MNMIAQTLQNTVQAAHAELAPDPTKATPRAAVPGALDPSLPWLRELLVSAVQLNSRGADDGVVDANGAPALPATTLTDYSGDELALMLAAIDSKIKEGQARTAKQGIEAARQRTDAANTEMADKLQEAIDQKAEAAEKAKSQKIWGWIGKIAAVIGAIVAVVTAAAAAVVSGAAATPLLALAVIGLVAATVDLASQINQEVNPGAESFSLGSLIGDAVIAQMDSDGTQGQGRAAAAGMMAAVGFLLMQPDLAGQMAEASALADGRSPEFAANMRMGVMIAAVVTTVIAMIVVTVASGGGSSSNLGTSSAKSLRDVSDDVFRELDDVADAADDVASAASKLQEADAVLDSVDVVSDATQAARQIIRNARYVQAVNGLAQGTAGIGQGVTGALVAQDRREADEARADAKGIEAMLATLQQQTEDQMARLKEIIQALQDGMAQFSQMIATAGDQRANLVRNQVRA